MNINKFFSIAFLATFFSLSANVAVAQSNVPFNELQGPGIAVQGSESYNTVPDKAKNFIADNFRQEKIMNVEKEFESGDFEIILSNGVELDFDRNGDLEEIEGLNSPLSYEIVKKLLPAAAYSMLSDEAVHHNVRKIEIDNGSYEVEFVKSVNSSYKAMKFDNVGNLLKKK